MRRPIDIRRVGSAFIDLFSTNQSVTKAPTQTTEGNSYYAYVKGIVIYHLYERPITIATIASTHSSIKWQHWQLCMLLKAAGTSYLCC